MPDRHSKAAIASASQDFSVPPFPELGRIFLESDIPVIPRFNRGFDMHHIKTRVLSSLLAGLVERAFSAECNGNITNKAGISPTHFYASHVGANNLEEDIPKKDTLDDGETFSITLMTAAAHAGSTSAPHSRAAESW